MAPQRSNLLPIAPRPKTKAPQARPANIPLCEAPAYNSPILPPQADYQFHQPNSDFGQSDLQIRIGAEQLQAPAGVSFHPQHICLICTQTGREAEVPVVSDRSAHDLSLRPPITYSQIVTCPVCTYYWIHNTSVLPVSYPVLSAPQRSFVYCQCCRRLHSGTQYYRLLLSLYRPVKPEGGPAYTESRASTIVRNVFNEIGSRPVGPTQQSQSPYSRNLQRGKVATEKPKTDFRCPRLGGGSLQDYQHNLLILERQNKRRLMEKQRRAGDRRRR